MMLITNKIDSLGSKSKKRFLYLTRLDYLILNLITLVTASVILILTLLPYLPGWVAGIFSIINFLISFEYPCNSGNEFEKQNRNGFEFRNETK